jgi:lipopolysaccharide biosynthesis glycosyltransferase
MKYLYVLISDASDYYLEQALLSITSLRLQMPNSFVSLLIDDTTDANLTGKRNEIRGMVNELISVKIDEHFNKKARSRWLKTSMRQHIAGDFLYIDCDTIITDDLSVLDAIDVNMGAILDENIDLSGWAQYNPSHLRKTRDIDIKLGFVSSINSNTYFNSGVLLCRDCTTGHDFFREWHRLWLYCFERGVLTDQHSFNQANYVLGNVIAQLENKWNCQILTNGAIKYLHDAKIIHYFATQPGEKSYLPANRSMAEKIKEAGAVDQELKNLLASPKGLFAPNARLILMDKPTREFYDSAIYAAAKRIFHSKFGAGFEVGFLWIRKNMFTPLRKKLSDCRNN